MMLRRITFVRVTKYRLHSLVLSSYSSYNNHGVIPLVNKELPQFFRPFRSHPLDVQTFSTTITVSSFNDVNSVKEFGRKLQQLPKQHSSRETIPLDEIKAIGKLILQYQDQLLLEFRQILYSFSMLKFTRSDFNNEVNDCLQRVGATYFANRPQSVYNYVNWLRHLSFGIQPYQLNDVNKGLALIDSQDCKSHQLLYNLGHLNVTWSSLSQEATNALQHKLVKELPNMNAKEYDTAIFGLCFMKVTYDQLIIAGSTLLQTIEKYTTEDKYLYKNLVDLKIPFAAMSENVRKLYIKGFKVKFISGNVYALYNLSEIIGDSLLPNDLKNDLKAFICNELPAMLISPSAVSQLSRLHSYSIRWSDIPEANQDLLINAIVNYLPVLSVAQKYFTMAGLFNIGVNYNSLPPILQQEMQNHLIELFKNTKDVNYINLDLRRLNDIGIQASQMNEELRELLRHIIKERLPAMSNQEDST